MWRPAAFLFKFFADFREYLEVHVIQRVAEVAWLRLWLMIVLMLRTRTMHSRRFVAYPLSFATLGTLAALRTRTALATLRTRTTLTTLVTLRTLTTLATLGAFTTLTTGRTLLVALGLLHQYAV